MKLQWPAALKGYNNGALQAITHATVCHSIINGLRQREVLFLKVSKLIHNMLISRLWLAKKDIDISIKYRYLKWPTDRYRSPPSDNLEIKHIKARLIDPRQQQDADRHNCLVAANKKRRQAGQRPVI